MERENIRKSIYSKQRRWCYVDSEGNKYNFAFGLNWDGIIIDERTKSYK